MRLRVLYSNIPFLLLAVFALLGGGCDTLPGVEDQPLYAPEVHPGTVFVDPEVIDTDKLSFSDGRATTEIKLNVVLTDADDDLTTVFAIVQSPVPGDDPIGELEASVAENGSMTLRVPIELVQGASGVYQVVVFAADRTERISNRIFGNVTVTAGSEPPVIDELILPSSITRPAEGEPPINLTLVALASDPDGAENILKVELVVNSATTLNMCDDGGTSTCNSGFGGSGDVLAGDGKFTLTIQLTSTNEAADYVFEFTAIDRSGLRSAPITRIVTVN